MCSLSSRGLWLNQWVRTFSSKTPIKSSVLPAVASSSSSSPETAELEKVTPPVPYFSSWDIRQLDPETKIKIHSQSEAVAKAQAYSLINNKRVRRRKPILIMPEEEYADKAILQVKAPLLDRRGEAESYFWRNMQREDAPNRTDFLCTVQADIDARPQAIKRWFAKRELEHQIKQQSYNPKRNKILGSDLAAAHVVVARGGKVKFMGHKTWITEYRTDAKPGVPEEDLPAMNFKLCTLPVNYDPKYRLEAVDASKVELHYEGLENFGEFELKK